MRIHQIKPQGSIGVGVRKDGSGATKTDFASTLAEARGKSSVTFSKHAQERLSAWGQELDQERLRSLQSAMDIASSKGARSTLVLLKGVAMLVAPQDRTVVTVIPDGRAKDNVFTSIDSAVLCDR